MNVRLSSDALADLEEIGDYIARDNPVRADSFVDEIVDCCKKIADMPEAYPFVPRYEQFGVRRRVFGSYLIFYEIGADGIFVTRILHGASDYASLLFPDD